MLILQAIKFLLLEECSLATNGETLCLFHQAIDREQSWVLSHMARNGTIG